MKVIQFFVLYALTCSIPVLGQLPQSHPELCGAPAAVIPTPLGMTATSRGVEVDLFFASSPSPITISGPGEVEEVCPLADGRLVVFASMMTGKSFSILDPTKPQLLDTVWAYDPRLSPNQKWIVFRKFFPHQTELPASDEYLLYDLSKSSSQNRLPDVDDERLDVGTAIYPLGWKNESGDNLGAPREQQHWHLSTFFWAPDSGAIVFADQIQGKRSVVFITVDEKGNTTASVSPFPGNMDCKDPGASAKGKSALPTGIQNVEFGPREAAGRLMSVEFEADGCAPKTVQLLSTSFLPATTEVRTIPPKLGKTTGK